jgi:glycosyltransferase involved in cell wall biosynthesis
VLVPPDFGTEAKAQLSGFGDLEILEAQDFATGVARSDIVHRPFQVSSAHDMTVLASLGDRTIITNQDLIGFRNASYYESATDWQTYRRLTAESLALSSLVLFFSEHARDDAISEGLVTHEKSRVVLIAPAGAGSDALEGAARPASRVDLEGRPFLLCLGTTFRHKNRIFAMRLLRALKERHNWDGRLVLAGPNVSNGSSLGDEAEWLSLHPAVAGDVVALPAMSEAEKNWLYENCTAVVYPTTYEGFGLVPFEAANFDKPTFFAPVTSLAELFPAESALLIPWNEDESADRVINVLRDPGVAAELVAQIRASGAKRNWDDTAQELLDAYDAVISSPSTDILRLDGPKLTVDERYWGFRLEMDPAGLSLVDPSDALLPIEAQRTIAGLARRSGSRAVLLASLRGLRRLATVNEPDDDEGASAPPSIFVSDSDFPRA